MTPALPASPCRTRWSVLRVAAFLAAAVVLAGCPGARRSGWESRGGAPLPVARWGAAVAVVDGRLLVAGGWTGSDLRPSLRFDAYDPGRDRWTRLPDLPDSLTHVIPARVGRRLWFAGGFSGSKGAGRAVRTVWTFDLDDTTWRPAPPLPSARAGGGLALLGDTLHYVGGFPAGGGRASAEHWALVPGRDTTWSARSPLPAPRGHMAVVVAGGRLYALGGQSEHDEHDVPACAAYDPATGRWTRLADLPTPRSHFEPSTLVEPGRIVVIGGCDNSCWRARRDLRRRHWREISPGSLIRALQGDETDRLAMRDVTAYDIAHDRWDELAPLPVRLLAPAAASVDGRLIVAGGSLDGWWQPQSAVRIGALPPGTAPGQ